MREYLSAVAGNAALRTRLGKELCAGTLPHALILEGPCGCGKSTLALEAVMALACAHRDDPTHPLPCRTCPTCRKILEGYAPDVIHIRRESGKTTMGVDTVRSLRTDVVTVPNDLSFKVYLIHEAHTMTQQAQNALLLTLEEPPSFVLFFLLTEDAGALLETVRSRAPVLRMQPVSDRELCDYLTSPARDAATRQAVQALRSESPAEFAALLRLSDGRIGRALELLQPAKRAPLLEQRATAGEICTLLAQRAAPDTLLSALLALGNSRDEVSARLLTLESALRDLLALQYSERIGLLFFTEQENALELAAAFTAPRLIGIADAVQAALDALAANANVRLCLVQLSLRIAAC